MNVASLNTNVVSSEDECTLSEYECSLFRGKDGVSGI